MKTTFIKRYSLMEKQCIWTRETQVMININNGGPRMNHKGVIWVKSVQITFWTIKNDITNIKFNWIKINKRPGPAMFLHNILYAYLEEGYHLQVRELLIKIFVMLLYKNPQNVTRNEILNFNLISLNKVQ